MKKLCHSLFTIIFMLTKPDLINKTIYVLQNSLLHCVVTQQTPLTQSPRSLWCEMCLLSRYCNVTMVQGVLNSDPAYYWLRIMKNIVIDFPYLYFFFLNSALWHVWYLYNLTGLCGTGSTKHMPRIVTAQLELSLRKVRELWSLLRYQPSSLLRIKIYPYS
jgi:hypothetical protein